MTEEEIRRAIQQALRDEKWRNIQLKMSRKEGRLRRKARRREEKLKITLSLEKRMGYLEADASAQRTAICKLERAVFIHSCSVAIQGAAITLLIWKVLT